MKGYWILSKALSISIEMIMWFMSLILFMCYITFLDLHILTKTIWILFFSSLCFLIGELRTFTFMVIIERYLLISVILLAFFLIN
jgi:hypothetical protein